jgi:Tol biopolymer transport system component
VAQPGTLARVPLSGGAPREVLDNVTDADYSPDGANLAVSHTVGGRNRIEFPVGTVLYEYAGGRPPSLRVSPKGDAVAFFEYDNKVGDFAVDVVDLHGAKKVLSRGWRGEGNLAWSPKGDEVWFAATKTGDPEVRAVDMRGKERMVVQAPAWLVLDDITRDGRALATTADSRIGITALPPGEKEERDLSWFDASYIYDMSADGKTILFVELSYGKLRNVAIYLRKTDGTPAVRLGDGNQPALSPDGKWVACIVTEGAQTKLTLLPTGAGVPRTVGVENIHYGRPEWFPDNRRILFTGNEPDRPARTFVQEVAGGKPRPVTPEGTTGAHVSPDGKTITVLSSGKLGLLPIDGGETKVIGALDPNEAVIRWSGDGHYLFLRRTEGPSHVKISRVDVATGRREPWKELKMPDPVGATIAEIEMTPDGSAYAYSFQRDMTTLFLVGGLK